MATCLLTVTVSTQLAEKLRSGFILLTAESLFSAGLLSMREMIQWISLVRSNRKSRQDWILSIFFMEK